MFGQPKQRRAFWITTGFIFVITVILCALVLLNDSRGVLAFAHIGTRFSEHDPNGTVGYDGQFVYFIARDGAEAVPYIDGATLRYQRILLPVAARAFAFGSADFVGWTILIINILAHSIGAGLVAYLLAEEHRAPAILGGIIYGLWIGGLFGVRFDLSEPLCFALSLAAVVAYRHERFRWTVFLLILATAAKELGLVIAAGLALHAFTHKKRGWSVLIFSGPALFFLAWWGVMRLWFGTLPTIYPAARTIRFIPFNGLFSEENPVEMMMLAFWLAIPAVVLLIAALNGIRRQREITVAASLMLAGGAFLAFMPSVSWQDPVAAYRVGMPVVVGGLLFVGQHFPRRMILLAVVWLTPLMILLLLPQLWLGEG